MQPVKQATQTVTQVTLNVAQVTQTGTLETQPVVPETAAQEIGWVAAGTRSRRMLVSGVTSSLAEDVAVAPCVMLSNYPYPGDSNDRFYTPVVEVVPVGVEVQGAGEVEVEGAPIVKVGAVQIAMVELAVAAEVEPSPSCPLHLWASSASLRGRCSRSTCDSAAGSSRSFLSRRCSS